MSRRIIKPTFVGAIESGSGSVPDIGIRGGISRGQRTFQRKVKELERRHLTTKERRKLREKPKHHKKKKKCPPCPKTHYCHACKYDRVTDLRKYVQRKSKGTVTIVDPKTGKRRYKTRSELCKMLK